MPLVLHTWLATLMRNRDRSDKIIIFDRDVHMPAKVAALNDTSQVCSLQLKESKRSDWARSYNHEVTQLVQTGVQQTKLGTVRALDPVRHANVGVGRECGVCP